VVEQAYGAVLGALAAQGGKVVQDDEAAQGDKAALGAHNSLFS
jgi:hypothetical protein